MAKRVRKLRPRRRKGRIPHKLGARAGWWTLDLGARPSPPTAATPGFETRGSRPHHALSQAQHVARSLDAPPRRESVSATVTFASTLCTRAPFFLCCHGSSSSRHPGLDRRNHSPSFAGCRVRYTLRNAQPRPADPPQPQFGCTRALRVARARGLCGHMSLHHRAVSRRRGFPGRTPRRQRGWQADHCGA